jgi:hypothetical protein
VRGAGYAVRDLVSIHRSGSGSFFGQQGIHLQESTAEKCA